MEIGFGKLQISLLNVVNISSVINILLIKVSTKYFGWICEDTSDGQWDYQFENARLTTMLKNVVDINIAKIYLRTRHIYKLKWLWHKLYLCIHSRACPSIIFLLLLGKRAQNSSHHCTNFLRNAMWKYTQSSSTVMQVTLRLCFTHRYIPWLYQFVPGV